MIARLLAPLLLAGLWWAAQWQIDRVRDRSDQAADESRLDQAQQLLDDELETSVADLRILAGSSEFRALSPVGSEAPDAAADLARLLLSEKPRYAGLRLFDATGRPRLQLEAGLDGVRRLEPQAEGRGDGRDLFDASRGLTAGTAYAARMDLAIERGQIEKPYRPVLRIALPLRSGQGDAQVVVLEQDGRQLLAKLAALLWSADTQGLLVDDRGDFLLHPDDGLRWGSALGTGQNMARRYPAAWTQMQDARGGMAGVDGRFRFRPIAPFPSRPGSVVGPLAERGWWLLLRREARSEWGFDRVLASPAFWIAQALLMTLQRTAAIRRRRQALQARRQAELAAAAAREAAAGQQIRDQVYQLSLSLQSASGVEAFARTLLSELAPLLGLSLAALYRLEQNWLRAVGRYGMPDDTTLRQFRLGDGLVSEALLGRRQISLDALPDGYIEVQSGLGRSAPAQLLIVPLWLREVNLGVLELGLLKPLDARSRAILDQSLPLVALHLANYRDAGTAGA